MGNTGLTGKLPQDEKVKVAYALNLCAVSISQIIDSNDIVVLKQERESILNNLNLQNFVKHPALLDMIKKILDTLTYFEIQAGDLQFVEREYQQKIKNAIWSAVPNLNILFAGGGPASMAVGIAAQIGIGYMNYRRNKSEYAFAKEKSEWELKRHELEQLYGLRAQLFETAWRLSSDYDFDDQYRLTERQLARYSEALLEADPLRRFERLDVMSNRFGAFPPFWYYKGNAAMETYKSGEYGNLAAGFRQEAIEAYETYGSRHFDFLREDVTAAACCLEHLSLLDASDTAVLKLLDKALRYAGENYDVLQQCVFVNIRHQNTGAVIPALRELIANGYNVGLNGKLLGRIYIDAENKREYEKLQRVAGVENIGEWGANASLVQKDLYDARGRRMADELDAMLNRMLALLSLNQFSGVLYRNFSDVINETKQYCGGCDALTRQLDKLLAGFKEVVGGAGKGQLVGLKSLSKQTVGEFKKTQFPAELAEEADSLSAKMMRVAKK